MLINLQYWQLEGKRFVDNDKGESRPTRNNQQYMIQDQLARLEEDMGCLVTDFPCPETQVQDFVQQELQGLLGSINTAQVTHVVISLAEPTMLRFARNGKK